ncbi:hypothetical protein HIM_02174 [Hirsutella minnesotensis 3608]|nr:hypothetical protein HIM_02174 [Hirsutella minnesotensis 3608]
MYDSSPTSASDSPHFLLYADDASRWLAVQERDPCADGFFVYAVKTTRIYCRPICKARLARRANVRFFAVGSEAQAAGFRACKRCKPDMMGFMPEDRAIQQIRALVASQGRACRSGMSLREMAACSGLSKWHFHRVFKKCVGLTPREYLQSTLVNGESAQTSPLLQQAHHQDAEAGLKQQNAASQSLVTNAIPPDVCNSLTWDDVLIWPEEKDELTGSQVSFIGE